jgi:hypothetical protein
LAKSHRYRALARERYEAAIAGELPAYYAKLEAEKRAVASTAQAPPDFSVRTLEATEWRDDERYPRFLLSTNSNGSRPTPPRNF